MSCGNRFLEGEKNPSPSFISCTGNSVKHIMLSIKHHSNYSSCMPICHAPLNETIGKTYTLPPDPKKTALIYLIQYWIVEKCVMSNIF